MKTAFISLTVLLLMTFTACTTPPSVSNSPVSPLPAKTDTPGPSTNSSGNEVSPINTLASSETTPPAPEANPFVMLVEKDLAKRLNIDVGQVHFLKINDIDWQDITKGCSDSPGQIQNKGRISGYSIWLETNGKNYLYHIGTDNTIFLCPE